MSAQYINKNSPKVSCVDENGQEICYLCGLPMSKSQRSLEHVTPKMGFIYAGDSIFKVWSHIECNQKKRVVDEAFNIIMSASGCENESVNVSSLKFNEWTCRIIETWMSQDPKKRGQHKRSLDLVGKMISECITVDTPNGSVSGIVIDNELINEYVFDIVRGIYSHGTQKYMSKDTPREIFHLDHRLHGNNVRILCESSQNFANISTFSEFKLAIIGKHGPEKNYENFKNCIIVLSIYNRNHFLIYLGDTIDHRNVVQTMSYRPL